MPRMRKRSGMSSAELVILITMVIIAFSTIAVWVQRMLMAKVRDAGKVYTQVVDPSGKMKGYEQYQPYYNISKIAQTGQQGSTTKMDSGVTKTFYNDNVVRTGKEGTGVAWKDDADWLQTR